MKLEFSRQIFEIYSNIKFHDNPSSGSEVNSRFRNFANASKKEREQNGKVGNEDEIVHYSVTGQIGDGKTGDARF